jgi:hypothetical protein
LALGTAPLPSASTTPPTLPPARFGRVRPDVQDPLDAPPGPLTRRPTTDQAPHRRRSLRVLLDDPADAALSLRTHMPPADLMELVLILAQSAADALRNQHPLEVATPSGLAAGRTSSDRLAMTALPTGEVAPA